MGVYERMRAHELELEAEVKKLKFMLHWIIEQTEDIMEVCPVKNSFNVCPDCTKCLILHSEKAYESAQKQTAV